MERKRIKKILNITSKELPADKNLMFKVYKLMSRLKGKK